MAGAFETIFDSFRDAAAFFAKRPADIAAEFAKVAALGLGAQLAFLFLIMATGVVAAGTETIDAALIGIIIAIALLAMAFFIVSTAISATPYCIVDGMRKGQKVGIISKTRELLPVVAGYCGAIAALFILAFGLALGGGFLFGGDQIISGFLMLGALCSIVAAVFLIQFALPEMAVGKADAFRALKSSFALVGGNVWTVLLFDIVLVIALFATVMVFSVPQGLIQAQMAAMAEDIAVSLLLFALSLAASLLETLIVSLISVNLIYSMWIGLKPPAPPPEPASRKRSKR